MQEQAKRWNPGDSGLCPFFQGGIEHERHRWFRCPRWAAGRASAGLASLATAFEHKLPQAMAVWGLSVLPVSVARWLLDRDQRKARQAPHPAILSPNMICVDGSGIHPKDRQLRPAAWATAWHDDLGWHTFAGPVPGA